MVFGTFDVVHPGHLYFLRSAKRYGKLIVVVARDVNVEKVKSKTPIHSEEKRCSNISKLSMVDEAVLGNPDDPYRIIEEKKPDIICLGFDQDSFTGNLEAELKKRELNPQIIRLTKYVKKY